MSDYRKYLINPFFSEDYSGLQYRDREEVLKLQEALFVRHWNYVIDHSPFYKRNFKGIAKKDVRRLEDISLLPFTDKDDLDRNNQDFLAADRSEIVDVCLTSGTSGGVPTQLLQTASDLRRLAFNEEIAFRTAGLEEGDTMVICAALGQCFMAGLAYFLGGTSLGCRAVRAGAVAPPQLWEFIKNLDCTAIVGVPSLMRKTAEHAVETGEDPAKAGVKKLIAIGESVRDADLKPLPSSSRLEELWGAELLSTYASTEIASTFAECPEKKGGHVRPELIVVEIVDEKGKVLAAGERGEVVVTPLGVQGMPLVRFKTGDISFLIEKPCTCGRTSLRLGPVLGRKNQMLKYKGTTVFPNTLLAAVEGDGRFHGSVVEARTNEDGTDRIIMHFSLNDNTISREKIGDLVRAYARVTPEINIIPNEEMDEMMYQPGKRKRIQFIDKRS